MQKKLNHSAAERVAKRIGQDIEIARKKRNLSRSVLADRANISVLTLGKIVEGDPGVGFGRYAAVMIALGFEEPLYELVSSRNDAVGRLIDESRLPKHTYKKRAAAKKEMKAAESLIR